MDQNDMNELNVLERELFENLSTKIINYFDSFAIHMK